MDATRLEDMIMAGMPNPVLPKHNDVGELPTSEKLEPFFTALNANATSVQAFKG